MTIGSMLLMFAGAALLVYLVRNRADPTLSVVLFMLWTGCVAGGLMAIASVKGERPGWRWGDRQDGG